MLAQHVAAVFGQPHHAALVRRVAVRGALREHAGQPNPLRQRAVGADSERRVALEQPLQRLERHAWSGPGRGIAGRDLPRIGEAGLQCRAFAPLEHHDIGAGACEVVSRADADHACTENRDFHVCLQDSKRPPAYA